MKIAYFLNSFGSINWGGQATSNGIKYLIEQNYKSAVFEPIKMPPLPFKKIKMFRKYFEKSLYNALMRDDIDAIYKNLERFNIQKDFFSSYTHVCFNGEGAIHSKSGHLIPFMALLYIAKYEGLKVAAINQTIDLQDSLNLENLVKKIYSNVDFLSVRETVSYNYVKNNLGLNSVRLIPDAAYGLPKLSDEEINNNVKKYKLPNKFIGITCSSSLKKDKKSLELVSNIITYINKYFSDDKIVFLANAKTDIWIAHKLKSKFDYKIIEPPVKYIDAISIISKAKILIGGRQHPNIFAYEYSVPYIPFGANTIKNIGVAKLQNYPVMPISWDIDYLQFVEKIKEIESSNIVFDSVKIDDFKIFGDI